MAVKKKQRPVGQPAKRAGKRVARSAARRSRPKGATRSDREGPRATSKPTRAGRASKGRSAGGRRQQRTSPRPVTAAFIPYQLVGASEEGPAGIAIGTRLAKVTQRASFRSGTARAGVPPHAVSVAADDVIEVEFEEGQRIWLRGDELAAQFGAQLPRAGEGTRTLAVPRELRLLPDGAPTRGPLGWAVKALRVLGVDLEGRAVEAIAAAIDRRTSPQRPGLGLFRCRMEAGRFALEPVKERLPAADLEQPFLVLVHGVFASTWGSFGELWSEARATELSALARRYGERALAFEHATLTEGPVGNALDLARALSEVLPQGARVHLLTHSRGGVVGELLCQAAAAGASGDGTGGFDREQLAAFGRRGKVHAASVRQLRELQALLAGKPFRVERFVRVACPVLGTTLASERLDRWLSVAASVASTALPDTPLADVLGDIGDLMLGLLKQRHDPRWLPGIEALLPDAPLVRVLNWPGAKVPGELTVIAGDIDPDKWWARLLVWASDRFFESDHDLLINTPSMFGGAERTGEALASLHRGPEVHHWNYFQNPASAAAIARALLREPGDRGDFEPLVRPAVAIAREGEEVRPAEPRPVLFVLPGIMGSELAVDGTPVWLSRAALFRGGLARLAIDAPKVSATQPLAEEYGAIVNRLARSHRVVPFAYDWRLPVEDEAERLAQAVRVELEHAAAAGQPLRILAHSMGGLVARTMIALHPDLWEAIGRHPGARLVMLGTPSAGSHSITELLVGRSGTLEMLALIDTRHDRDELLEIIARFPGVLSLLPRDPREDYFAHDTWISYRRRSEGTWVVPEAGLLAGRAKWRALLDRSPIDPERMIYVAGRADATPESMFLDPHATEPEERIQFRCTARGDGRVPWDTGIPPELLAHATYYMDVVHGDLASVEEGFDAIEEILATGRTTALPQTPGVARGIASFVRPRARPELFPDDDRLRAGILGSSGARGRRAARREPQVRVKIAHGNLAYASHPVAVGHYVGDTIISAERYLDSRLEGALSRRSDLGRYPGPIGTCAIFVNPRLARAPDATPKGAIVIGLGAVGELSSATLAQSFTKALIEYALEWTERTSAASAASANESRSLGVTGVLIGTGAAGISIADSLQALLLGVLRANEAFSAAKQRDRIGELEIIELWEDRAIQAVHALARLRREPWFRGRIAAEPDLATWRGGQRRIAFDEPSGWWQRLQILGGGAAEPTPVNRPLRFSSFARLARSEVRLLGTQRAVIDRFIEESIRTVQVDRALSRTLFELLLPNELKEQAPAEDNLVLLVDEEAARYPWELLEDSLHPDSVPFAVEHGVLRQLESREFRAVVDYAIGNRALVVGDPVSSFPPLPGAQREAEDVWRALQARDFVVEKRIRPDAQDVMIALYAHPYRVLHLAGHGVYRQEVPVPDAGPEVGEAAVGGMTGPAQPRDTWLRLTGMIIGDGTVLSPQEVAQMRLVPELVFINCCHLGKIEQTGGSESEQRDFHRLAANLATQFIRNGVRAVIAAGWAVDDDAASTFARTFYARMLSGVPFGAAVLAARRETYEQHPRVNTWGAYQCYGDPDFRLVRLEVRETASQADGDFVAPAEAVLELDGIAARLVTRAGEAIGQEVERIAAIRRAVAAKGWTGQGAILAAIGRAYGEARLFDEAIAVLRQAMRAEDAAATVKDVEQLANFEIRRARERWSARKGRVPAKLRAEVLADIDAGMRRLALLEPTAERLSLLGSACKRKVLIAPDEAPGALKDMVDAYRRAFELAGQAKRVDPYALANWAAGALAMRWREADAGAADGELTAARTHFDRGRAELARARAARRDFWTIVAGVDLDLAATLIDDALTDAAVGSIGDAYQETRRLASPREFASVIDQLEFLHEMASGRDALARRLGLLLDRLREA